MASPWGQDLDLIPVATQGLAPPGRLGSGDWLLSDLSVGGPLELWKDFYQDRKGL